MLHKVLLEPNTLNSSGGAIASMDDVGEAMTEANLAPLSVPVTQGEAAQPVPDGERPSDRVISVEMFGEDVPNLLKGDDKVATEPAKPSVEPTAAKPTATERDYSMFRPEDAEILKKSRNEVYEFAKIRLPEIYKRENEANEKLKQVEGKVLPESYYQHPESYVLSADYKAAQTDVQYAAFEEAHWRKQLVSLKGGETKLKMLTGFNDSKPVYEDVEISPEQIADTEIRLAENLSAAAAAKQSAYRAAREIQQSFQSTFKNTVDVLKQSESKYYPFYEKPTESQKKIMSEIESMIPTQFRSNPLSSYLVKAGTLNVELINRLNEATREIAQLKSGKSDPIKKGPNGSEITSSGGSSNGAKMLDFKMFGEE